MRNSRNESLRIDEALAGAVIRASWPRWVRRSGPPWWPRGRPRNFHQVTGRAHRHGPREVCRHLGDGVPVDLRDLPYAVLEAVADLRPGDGAREAPGAASALHSSPASSTSLYAWEAHGRPPFRHEGGSGVL